MGRSILITGGGRGIGRATALLFVREGARHVSVVDLVGARAKSVADEIEGEGTPASAIEADVTDPESCARTVDEARAQAGGLDVVISNAGWGCQNALVDTPVHEWDKNIAVNLSAHFYVGKAAARSLIAQGTGGVILFTTSTAAYGGTPGMGPYAAAKAGLHNLVKTFSLELAPHGIRVNSVSPGSTDTPLAEEQVGKEVFDQMREAFPVPLGRLARPEEIGRGFLYLASDDASFVTGFDLVVDGGSIQFAVSFGSVTQTDAPAPASES